MKKALKAVAALATGHLEGTTEPAYRSALAVGCVARSIRLALLIAASNQQMENMVRFTVGFMTLGSLAAIPWSVWMTRRNAKGQGGAEGTGGLQRGSCPRSQTLKLFTQRKGCQHA